MSSVLKSTQPSLHVHLLTQINQNGGGNVDPFICILTLTTSLALLFCRHRSWNQKPV